jgi:hypothetical protein
MKMSIEILLPDYNDLTIVERDFILQFRRKNKYENDQGSIDH